PGVAHRKVFLLGILPGRPNHSRSLLQVIAYLLAHRLNFVAWIRFVKWLIESEKKVYIKSIHPDCGFLSGILVIMPGPLRRENQIVGFHGAFLAVDHSE